MYVVDVFKMSAYLEPIVSEKNNKMFTYSKKKKKKEYPGKPNSVLSSDSFNSYF